MIRELLVLCALWGTCSAGFLYVAPLMRATRDQFVRDFDVRAEFEDFAVVLGDIAPPNATRVGVMDPAVQHYVVLYQHLSVPGFNLTVQQWNSQVRAIQSIHILHDMGSAVLLTAADEHSLLKQLSVNTELILLLSQRILPQDSTLESVLRRQLLRSRQRNPIIDRLVSLITVDDLTANLNVLTGVTDAFPGQKIVSRNSIHAGGKIAADWITQIYSDSGFKVEQVNFRAGYNPNVIATLEGTGAPDQFVVLGAHADSRGPQATSATAPAPGANDNGSGTATLLNIAKAIKAAGVRFYYTLILVSFSGEEQGLFGSANHAQSLRARGASVVGMLNADMVAYRRPGEGIQCGFPQSIHTPLLTELARATMTTYTPEIQLCTTTACCSDHQSYISQGFAATALFERCGSIADPQYHQVGDIVARTGYDIPGELLSMAKAMTAITAVLADING